MLKLLILIQGLGVVANSMRNFVSNSKLMSFLFVVAFMVGSLILREFPNLWAIVVSILFLLPIYPIQKLAGDKMFREYAENAHILRVIFFGTAFFCFISFLSGLTIWGAIEMLKEGSFLGTVYIESKGPGKRLPSGEYSVLAVLLMTISSAAFFTSFWIKLVVNGSRGLVARFRQTQPKQSD